MRLWLKIESVLADCFYFSAFWAGLAGVGYSLGFRHGTFHEVFLVSLLLLLFGVFGLIQLKRILEADGPSYPSCCLEHLLSPTGLKIQKPHTLYNGTGSASRLS